jgi:tyrosinase
VVALAARDPVFFLHHANIDRLWSTWNRRGNANSPEPMWRGLAFNRNFINPDGSPWNVSVGDLGSPAALGYRYDDDNDPFAADMVMPSGDLMTEKLHAYRRLHARGALSFSSGTRRIELQGAGNIVVAAAENNLVASREKPIEISVPLGRSLADFVSPESLAFQPGEAGSKQNRRYVWAFVHDIEAPLDATTRVRVFCNCKELSTRIGPDHPSYATTVSFLGGDHAGHGDFGRPAGLGSICVDLSPALARNLRGDRLTVQLLPHCSNNEANVSNFRPRRVEVVIL